MPDFYAILPDWLMVLLAIAATAACFRRGRAGGYWAWVLMFGAGGFLAMYLYFLLANPSALERLAAGRCIVASVLIIIVLAALVGGRPKDGFSG